MLISRYFSLSLLPAAALSLVATPSFSKTNGTLFNIDGVTTYYAGSNAYWLAFLTKDADIDLVLDHFAASGTKVLRIWGFNDVNKVPTNGAVYFQVLSASGSTINTGANGLQRLKYVVKAAEARGIKLIINFTNNWADYGGIPAYVTAFGGSKESWYTNTKAQAQYQKYIQAVIIGHENSTAIFAWELANEPRCKGCNTDVLTKWASTTSAYIKSLAPNHMVTLGDEGFGLPGASTYPYQTSEGVDFVKNLAIKTLDFGVLHMYPEAWGQTAGEFGGPWIENHAKACKAAGKPCLLEEYGYRKSCSVMGSWQKSALANANAGMAGDMFWQWGDRLTDGSNTADDGNTIFYNQGNATCLVTNHINDIKAAKIGGV